MSLSTFVMPVPSLESGRCQDIVGRYARAVQASLASALEASGEAQLAEIVSQSLIADRNLWRPELGVIRQCVRSGQEMVGALHWAAAFAEQPLNLRFELAPGARILIDGHGLQFDSAVSVSVCDNLLAMQSTEVHVTLVRKGDLWVRSDSSDDRPHPSWPRYTSTIDGVGVPGTYPDPIGHKARCLSPDHPEGVYDAYRDAFALIGSSTSPYGEWIRSTTTGVVLTSGDAEVSSTDPSFPGMVVLKNVASTVEAVGRLADATSQQKLFQMALAFAPTVSGGEEIHYLRSRRTYTTTRRLLASALQHVNAIGALSSFTFLDDARVLGQTIASRRLLLECECWPALDASKTLTQHGAQLWRDLKRAADSLPVRRSAKNDVTERETELTTET